MTTYSKRNPFKLPAEYDWVFPYIEWIACWCGKKNHTSLDGFTAHYQDPVWDRLVALTDHKCRCERIFLLPSQVALRPEVNVPGLQRLPQLICENLKL